MVSGSLKLAFNLLTV